MVMMSSVRMDDEDDGPKKVRKMVDPLGDDESFWEMDVYTAMPSESSMYRVQFPQRKMDIFDKKKNTKARLKANAKLLEVSVDADIHNGSHEIDRLGRIETDGKNRKEIFEGRSFSDTVQYCVAHVQGSALILTPLDGSIEMKRTLGNLKQDGEKTENEGMDTESETEDTAPQAVRVKFMRQETERQKKRREGSALHREKMLAAETWEDLHVQKDTSRPSLGEAPPIDSREVSTRELVSLSLGHNEPPAPTPFSRQTRVRDILVQCTAISTERLECLLDPPIPREELLPLVKEVARIVRGVWVVRSELIFRTSITATRSRMTEERVHQWRDIRDFALCLLDAGEPVTRATLTRMFRLSKEDASSILETIGTVNTETRTWRLPEERGNPDDPPPDDLLEAFVHDGLHWQQRWDEILAEHEKAQSPRRIRRHSARNSKA